MQQLVAPPNYAIFLFCFLTIILLSFLLEHVLPMAEILSSSFEKKVGVLEKEQCILRTSQPLCFLTIQSDCLDLPREGESLKTSHGNTGWLKAAPG